MVAIVWILHTVPDGAWVLVNLVVVTTFKGLVPEEVDSGVIPTTGQVLLILDVLQAIPLVPACWEDVEGDLAADGITINNQYVWA